MQQHHGNRIHLLPAEGFGDDRNLLLVGIGMHCTVTQKAGGRLQDEPARNQGLLLLKGKGEGVGELGAADLQDAAIAAGHDQAEARATPLDDRVEAESGAVHDQVDIGWLDPGALDQRRQAALDGPRRILGHARLLVARQLARRTIC
jgi:hypothetical protein